MGKNLDWVLAERRGSRTANEFGVSSFPVDPKGIALQRNIRVEGRPLTGCQGCLVKNGDAFGIVYATGLGNEGMVNFTIAHELGHYFLQGHPEALFPDGDGIHQSQGAFTSGDTREREADHFAAGLLMPEQLFVPEMRRVELGLQGVEALASACGTSLTATAIRYAMLSEDVIALFSTQGKTVNFCFMSEPLRDLRGIDWPRKGSAVPNGTLTWRYNQNPERVQAAKKEVGAASLSDWVAGAPDVECVEEVVGLGRFGQTLTLVWCKDALPEADELDDDL